MSDYRNILDYLRVLEDRIVELNEFEIVYCVSVDTGFFKKSVNKEIAEWREAIAKALKTQASTSLKEMTNFLEEQGKVLANPPHDVENAKKILVSLDLIREKEVDEDLLIGPIEVRSAVSPPPPPRIFHFFIGTEKIRTRATTNLRGRTDE